MNYKDLNIKGRIFKISTLLLICLTFACSPTRRLTEDQKLYNKAKIKIEDGNFDKSLLKKYERISENKRVLGVRFHLWLYNLANPDKKKFPNNWLRKIGEPPVIYDSTQIKQNVQNFDKFLSDIGYTDAQVSYKITDESKKESTKKIDVTYSIDLNEPTIINKYDYYFEDTSIQRYVYADTSNSLISEGSNFNKHLLEQERLRIERILKDEGYYKFSKEYIFFEVKKADIPHAVNVRMYIKQNVSGYIDPVLKVRPHKKYIVREVLINPNVRADTSGISKDTIEYNNFEFLKSDKLVIRPSTLIAASRIEPDQLYSLSNVNKTYSNLSGLGLFRFIDINFKETEPSQEFGNLDANIDLAMRKRQSYAVEATMIYSKDLGARGSITYDNYNLFRGGEHFQLGLTGAYESLKQRLGTDEPMMELGVSSKFETPKFLLPFYPEEFQRKYSPRTAFELSYNFQNQPNSYTRTIANASIGYNWKGNTYNKHSVYPIDFYLVKLPYKNSTYFADYIANTRLAYSFKNHSILGIRYVFQYTNQTKGFNSDFIYFHSNLEQAGLALNQVNKWSSWGVDSMFFGVKYSQYIRSDIDFRQFMVIDKVNRIVYRFYAGIGVPYGNSKAMPFEKMFGSGGPYGMRAWQEYTLGPGSYPDTTNNQLGDIKLEANLEYRFKMFWILEGALFTDVGNVWLLKEDKRFPGGDFKLNSFYNDLAVGVGFGFRFDLSFVVLRTDFGFKLRNPAIQPDNRLNFPEDKIKTGSKWTVANPDVSFWNPQFQIGIGYPF